MLRGSCAVGEVTVAAADPLNLVGVVVPGERVAAVPGKSVTFFNGAVQVSEATAEVPQHESLTLGLFPVPPNLLPELQEERARV